MTSRRAFLQKAVIAAAALAVDPGQLWTPKKTIFLPPEGGWRTNNDHLTLVGFLGEFTAQIEKHSGQTSATEEMKQLLAEWRSAFGKADRYEFRYSNS